LKPANLTEYIIDVTFEKSNGLECYMKKIKAIIRSDGFVLSALLFIVAGLIYLPFISRFEYFNDDWYLMYAAGAKGPLIFNTIFSIDRPLRALVMIPAYYFFGPNPLYYNLSAFVFRLSSGLFFLWVLRMVWPRQRWMTLSAALLFLTYPGFLSQPNAIDYQSHLSGLAAGMLSIALTVKAIQAENSKRKAWLYFFSVLTGWFYLSQIEWYIGLELFRFACIFILASREKESLWRQILQFLRWAYPVILVPTVYLVWRIFIFKSERGATDINLQFSDVLSSPLTSLSNWARTLGNDTLDVLFSAWFIPLRRLGYGITNAKWLAGFGIAALVLTVAWIAFSRSQKPGDEQPDHGSGWKREVFWLGVGMILFGLLPVILVGRSVDFKSYSRYTMIASVGAALLWAVGLSYIANVRLRTALLSLLILSAALTHYANGLTHANDTAAVQNFWWQVSWRIPQLETGTTLVAHYPVTAEEDYFIWGPANLIYHPESAHADYVQPAIYAALLNDETTASVLAKQPQDFSNRRGIRTYKNYRNILILSQPTPASCIQVVDGNQVELSSAEDPRVVALAPYSETTHILLGESFQTPPATPFGAEPAHGWCYYYQKATYARQTGNWDEVARLGNEAHAQGFTASDPIEWMPFLQAAAHFDHLDELNELAPSLTPNLILAQQACHTLRAMPLSASTLKRVNQLFCTK
jgi:hypothetical protein